MDIYTYLEDMQNELMNGDGSKFEQKYYTLCSEKSGVDEANRIQSVNIDQYRQFLENGISKSLELATKSSAKAIYFEYDMDNEWSSHFFVCDEYRTLEEQDDDWACDWLDEVKGPDLVEFADVYSVNGFDKTDQAVGITLYLVARTVSTFASVCKGIEVDISICIAFHDQEPIMRIKE